jgi:SHS2 domain-containing protein
MNSKKPDFTLLDHTADLGIIVRGRNLRNLFEVAAKSMMYIMVKGKPADTTKTLNLSVEGYDLADLMVRWLGEILYLFEGEHELVTGVEITSVSHSHLDATLETICMKYCVKLRRLHFIKSKSLKRMNTGRPGLFSIYKKTSR